MPVDILLFRDEQGLRLVRDSQKARYQPEATVQKVLDLDAKLRQAKHGMDEANQLRNKLNDEIKNKRIAKEDTTDLQKGRDENDVKIGLLKAAFEAAEVELNTALNPIGNIVHSSVLVSDNEDNNAVVKTWGEFPKKNRYHHELLYLIDGYESVRGVNVAGHRAYFLKGVGVQLNMAVINYSMDFLTKRGFTMLQPPYFMKKDVMAKTAQLSQFDEELYKVVGDEDKYLIATSEQPISALHMNEWMDAKQLPIRYGGFSTNFRKEAGSHGKDAWGIFRVHQFDKIEQFCITSPDDDASWKMHEEMLKNSEEFFQSLGIPYRVVVIVSGALNNAASKKYDLEGWFPASSNKDVPAQFRELVSCSNCTDYQSRAMEIRYGSKKQGAREKKYVHMLNSTLCATTRAICAILENYQTDDGVAVPPVLRPYMGGKEFIPFVHKEIPVAKGAKGKVKADKKAAAAQNDNSKGGDNVVVDEDEE